MSKLLAARRWLATVALYVFGVALTARPSRAADLAVTARESIVRTAPFAVAPAIARVHAGDKLPADDQPQGDWRRVLLPDGRRGFLREADINITTPPAAAQAPPAPVGSAAPEPGTIAPAAGPGAPLPSGAATATGSAMPDTADLATPESLSELALLGVVFEVMPSGTLSPNASGAASDVDEDATGSVAVAPFLDVPVSPNVALGLSPQFIFGVQAKGASASATEYDLRARLIARYPMSPNGGVYARFSPGYSIIALPAGPNPKGFLFDFAVGAEIAVLPKLFLVTDVGYQVGLQSATTTAGDGTATSSGFSTRYLHVGAGFAIGL